MGRGSLETLLDNRTWLEERHDLAPKIVAIYDLRFGTALTPKGPDLKAVLSLLKENKDLEALSEAPPPKDAIPVIRESRVDVVLELTPTNLETGEPAVFHIRAALSLGKHVVTTNKSPVACYYCELAALAKEKGVQFRFEGTVMAGTPVFSLLEHGFAPRSAGSGGFSMTPPTSSSPRWKTGRLTRRPLLKRRGWATPRSIPLTAQWKKEGQWR